MSTSSPPSIPPNHQSAPNAPSSPGERLSPMLTCLSHLPTPFVTTFLLIHLSAPAAANFGGSALSSQVMLLGREYYQGAFSEPWLVFAPLGIHIAAGITKRFLSATPVPRHPSLLTITAYPLLLFLPIHVLTHRLIPSDPAPPILALSPSELDYEFIKAAFTNWPVRTWGLYTGLVVCAVVHAFEGWDLILRTWVAGKGFRGKRKRAAAGAAVGVLLSGLLVVAKEPLLAFQSTLLRIHNSYSTSVVYRI